MKYEMTKIVNVLIDWMKEAGCYENRKAITFSVLNDGNIDILTPDSGKMIGKKGVLVRKYSKIIAEVYGLEKVHVEVNCPDVLCTIGSGDDVIIYCSDNT